MDPILDPMTSRAQMSAFSDELQKIAARAGLKLIRKLVAKGDPKALARAQRISTTPGVLKKTMAGSQVKHLGAGMEGVSTLTAHPKRGLEVRKVIDPKGIAGPKMVANREAAGKALRGSSDVAEFRGAYNTPGGLRAQRFEYAPGRGADSLGAAAGPSTAVGSGRGAAVAAAPARGGGMTQQQRAQAQMKRLKLQGERKGFQVADLHEGNVMMGQQGGGKAVDFIPVPKDKNVGLNQANFSKAMEAQEMAAKGQRTPMLNYLEHKQRPGSVMAQAFRKAPPMHPGQYAVKTPMKAAPAPAAAARPSPAMPSTAPSRPKAMARMPAAGPSTAPVSPKAVKARVPAMAGV